ncbi:anti-phage dCTP deaminase [uncultured Idiomarina sp.]|uniref:anti-phage dCTP deaminase n=1 Tax=uncultured Idiomarina sp. TaxID=352961 RepID=UPI0025921BDA|nr:anti-phage dCTP deaminase [uncultured Idiomarina sp.]
MEKSVIDMSCQANDIDKPEIVIAFVAAVGTDISHFANLISQELSLYDYCTEEIRVSKQFLDLLNEPPEKATKLQEIEHYMTLGNEVRKVTENNAALAYSAITLINQRREELSNKKNEPLNKHAWLVRSLKHPEEVKTLREAYGDSLYIIGIHSDEEVRERNLKKLKRRADDKGFVDKLIRRDEDELEGHGQHTSDTFHLSDFFIDSGATLDKNKYDIERVFQLIFDNPFLTPTFDEYAMFMAFSASTRSADLSRQVGAVIAKDENIISTGANDVPRASGGLYWPINTKSHGVIDEEHGRDYMVGYDSNRKVLDEIIEDLLKKLKIENSEENRKIVKSSKLGDITEYGRVVHAEMEAILSCGRTNNTTVGTTLYCTTFPCHNCAKHIIASGIMKVVYVEPYSKSRALEFHKDSVTTSKRSDEKVFFSPFVGVGPKNFLNFFSLKLGSGAVVKRKDKNTGNKLSWSKEFAKLRIEPDVMNYLSNEETSLHIAKETLEKYDQASQKNGE